MGSVTFQARSLQEIHDHETEQRSATAWPECGCNRPGAGAFATGGFTVPAKPAALSAIGASELPAPHQPFDHLHEAHVQAFCHATRECVHSLADTAGAAR